MGLYRIKNGQKKKLSGTGVVTDIEGATVEFTQASTRTNIVSGESISTLFGKVKKWFADLSTVAFSGSYADLSNTPTIDSALSDISTNAVQNKVIKARLDEVFTSVSNGKALIASAITDKGVPTQSDATFSTMATNISNIPSGGGTALLGGLATFVPLSARGGVGIGNIATIIENQ